MTKTAFDVPAVSFVRAEVMGVVLVFALACTSAPAEDARVDGLPGGRDIAESEHWSGAVAEVVVAEDVAAELTPELVVVEDRPPGLIVFLRVRSPLAANQGALLDALITGGLEAEAEGDDEVVLFVDEEVFVQRFHAHIGTSTTGASASDRIITIQTLDSYRIPRELRRFVQSVYFDPQR